MDLRWPIIAIIAAVTGLVEWFASGRYFFDPNRGINAALFSAVVVTAIAGVFILRISRERRGRPVAYRWAFLVLLLYLWMTITGSRALNYDANGKPPRPAASGSIGDKLVSRDVTAPIDRSPGIAAEKSRLSPVEGWEIYRPTKPDVGCSALGKDDETSLAITLTPTPGLGYVLIANQHWTKVEDRTYPMTIQFDTRTGWTLDGRGQVSGEPTVFLIEMPFDSPAFLADFLKGGVMEIRHAHTEVGMFKLTPAVGQALMRCQGTIRPAAAVMSAKSASAPATR